MTDAYKNLIAKANSDPTQAFSFAMRTLDAISTPHAYFLFQYWLIREMLWAEEQIAETSADEPKDYLANLRQLGDGLAQILIHPDTLRQLQKNSARVGRLSDQVGGLAYTLGHARALARIGHPVVVADTTNVVRIGDVIDCKSREYPKIYEVKSKRPGRGGGRNARQKNRIHAVIRALNEGVADMPDEEGLNVIMVSGGGGKMRHQFPLVQAVVDEALRGRTAHRWGESGDLIFATPGQGDPDKIIATLDPLMQKIPADRRRIIYVKDFLEISLPRVPSPTVWPLSIEARLAIMHGSVLLFHVLDLQCYLDEAARAGVSLKIVENSDSGFLFDVLKEGSDSWQIRIHMMAIADTAVGFRAPSCSAETLVQGLPGYFASLEKESTGFSNVPGYREAQIAKGVDSGAPHGEIVFDGKKVQISPMMVASGRFADGPWNSYFE